MKSIQGAGAVALAISLLVGCHPPYKGPKSSQPHAVVKYRRVYHSKPGPALSEWMLVNDDLGFSKDAASSEVPNSQTDAFLVHPGKIEIEAGLTFTHQRTEWVTETYACGTARCSRTVTRQVTVVDGRCDEDLGVIFHEGSTYLLEAEFLEGADCVLHCMIQKAGPDGTFENRPCDTYPLD
jgi:hypothetical protein